MKRLFKSTFSPTCLKLKGLAVCSACYKIKHILPVLQK